MLALYGLAVPFRSQANFVPVDSSDKWLHLVLGIGMIVLGLVAQRARRSRTV